MAEQAGGGCREGDGELGVVLAELRHLTSTVAELKGMLSENYVRKESFEPVKQAVFGLVGIILIAFIGALSALAFR